MRDRTFERIGALSGLAFFVLAVLSGFIYPQQPRVDSAPAKTLAWVHDHHTALQAGMIFDFFAAGVLLWFAGYLYRVLRRAEGDVESLAPIVLAAGIGVSITTAIAALPTVLLAFMDAQPGGLNDLSLVRALGDLNTIFFSATSVMTAVFLAALGLGHAARRARPPAGSAGSRSSWPPSTASPSGSASRSAATTATPGSSSAGAPTSASSSSCSSPASSCCAGPAPSRHRRPGGHPCSRRAVTARHARSPTPTVRPYGIRRPQCPPGSSRRRHAFPPDPTPQPGLRQ